MSTESEFVRVVIIKGDNGVEKTMKFPMNLDLYRPKRPRTMFTDEQLQELEEAFRSSGYLNGQARAVLATKLGLSDTQVKVWFQNRRTKDKKKPADNSYKEQSPSCDISINHPKQIASPLLSSATAPVLPTLAYPFFNPSQMMLQNPYLHAYNHFHYSV